MLLLTLAGQGGGAPAAARAHAAGRGLALARPADDDGDEAEGCLTELYLSEPWAETGHIRFYSWNKKNKTGARKS